MLERYSTIKVKWKNKQKPLLIIPIYVGWTTVLLVSFLLSQYYYERATVELELGSVLKHGRLNSMWVIGKAVNGVEGSPLS